MQNILSKKERQLLSSHYRAEGQQHPLLLACDAVFAPRAAKLEAVKAESEDVFRLTAWVIDKLTQTSEILSQQDVDDLFTALVKEIREWKDATVTDRRMIADTVFRIVRKLLCHHWDEYYSDRLYSLFTNAIERESVDGDKEEQERFQSRLSEYSEQLSEWINNGYDGNLSAEIEAVAKGQNAEIKPLKPRSGRKSIDPDSITASFSYLPRIEHRTERLQAFFDCLNRVFVIADKMDFIDMFQGKTTTKKILWIRDIKELHYLIDHLESWIEWPKSYDKWQMTCARFLIRLKAKKKVDDSMTNDSFTEEPLKQTQFSKGSKVPQTHEELDKIIRILDPRTDLNQGLQDYLDFFDQQGEHDELKDYRDALANDLRICSRL